MADYILVTETGSDIHEETARRHGIVVVPMHVNFGEVSRDDQVRLVRDGIVVYEGKIASLRRYKDDVKSVKAGFECGIGLENFQDIHVGDVIESYRIEEVARTE